MEPGHFEETIRSVLRRETWSKQSILWGGDCGITGDEVLGFGPGKRAAFFKEILQKFAGTFSVQGALSAYGSSTFSVRIEHFECTDRALSVYGSSTLSVQIVVEIIENKRDAVARVFRLC